MLIRLRQGNTNTLVFLLLITFNLMIFRELLLPRPSYAAELKSRKNTSESGAKLYEEGMAAHKEGDLDKAISKFKKAVKKLKKDDPLRKQAYFRLGYCYYLLADYTEAREYFDEAKPFTGKKLKEDGISPKIITFATSTKPTDLEKKQIANKPWYKKWYWWALIAAAIGGGVAAAVAGGGGGGGSGGITGGGDDGGGNTDSIPISW